MNAITKKTNSFNCLIFRLYSTLHPEIVESKQQTKLGYIKHEDGTESKDKLEGQFHVGIVNLPEQLNESLEVYYKNHPSKRIREDGLRLSRYLLNRGRPTNSTWSKYKSNLQGSDKKHSDDEFSIKDAANEGLIHPDIASDVFQEEENTSNYEEKHKIIKKPHKAQYSVIRYGGRETSAYIASQLPSVYGATYRALHEIKKRVPEYKPKTLLDFGSGSGMTVWTANELWRNEIKEYQCVDASEKMIEAAEFLLRGSDDLNHPLKIPNVFFKRFLPLSNKVLYDIVVSSYSLTEMPFRKQRLQAIKSLWKKTNDFLVLVEPGNNDGFEAVLLARQFLTEGKSSLNDMDTSSTKEFAYNGIFNEFDVNLNDDFEDGHIFAPCPHEMVCARAYVETRDHPCNFTQKVELSFSQKYTELKQFGYYNNSFSYVILRKGKEAKNSNVEDRVWTRILKPIKPKDKHIICELCSSNGNIEKHILTKKKDPFIYKAARHRLKQGDMMPLDEARRPMNIRKPIKPCITPVITDNS
ncbi:ribosome assembly protein METTL17, mitochondrial isoform X2 [Hydra vulgaris]|uniref:Ribosome assembly protein METTL17, mitochondrial isoform X2 n=1 Tax=Hydra vulgaris TaxID=6087 RepID=A0ABM4DE68_HYDVU